MKNFIEEARFYAKYHEKQITLYTHLVGVPLILFGFMILLGFFQLIVPGVFATTLASIGACILFVYYLFLNWRLSLLLLPILVFLVWLSSLVSHSGPTSFALWTFAIVFVLGWVIQLSGHLVEGKKPAFMDNLLQALIAPLYLTAEVCFMLGRMQALKEKIHGASDQIK